MKTRLTINRVLFALYSLASIGVLVTALIFPAFRQVAYAPLRDVLVPEPEPVVITLLYSTEKAAWLDEVIPAFYATDPTVNGRPIRIEGEAMGSREMYLAVLNDERQPDIFSPASMLQVSLLEDLSRTRNGFPYVVASNANQCPPVVQSPVVLVAWTERADALWGSAPGDDLWQDLADAMTADDGWAAYGHPEWGYIKFGHTNPLTSNSGFQTILLLTYNYFDKTSGLTSADILGDAGYQAWFTELEGSISTFGNSTGTYMEEIVAYGPSRYDMVAVYESVAIEQAANAEGRYGPLQIYYPPATHMSDHPFCIMEAEWVTAEESIASRIFIDYLLSREAQELAVTGYGFRPADSSVSLTIDGSPWARATVRGLQTDLPPEVEVPPGDVLQTLLDFWQRNVGG